MPPYTSALPVPFRWYHARPPLHRPSALSHFDTLAPLPPHPQLSHLLNAPSSPQAALFDSQISTTPSVSADTASSLGGAAPTLLNAMLLTYLLDGSFDRKKEVDAWELLVRDRLVGAPGTPGGAGSTLLPAGSVDWPDLLLSVRSDAILSDDITSATSHVVSLIVLGIVAMAAYVSVFLSRDSSLVGSRAPLGGMAMLSIMLATLAAFGMVAYSGVAYNEMVNVAIFVMLGVGVDDAFIIVSAFEDRLEDVAKARLSRRRTGGRMGRGRAGG